jgi:replicative DNA helicase
MRQLDSEGKAPDLVEMGGLLQKNNVNIGKFITTGISSSEITRQRIIHLQDIALRRQLLAIFYKGEVMACDQTTSLEEVQQLYKELAAVTNRQTQESEQRFSDVSAAFINNVALRTEDKGEQGMMTGLHIFDSRFGWHGGDLIIIAGETSMGKSTLATTIAYNMAVQGIPSAYYSLEMSAEQLVARIVARDTKVSSSMMLYGKLNPEEYNRVYDRTAALKNLPIYFDEDSKTSFPRVCASIRRMVKKNDVKVVFIDYLQILANGNNDNREQLIGDMARDLKRLAVEQNIVIVALSQLARSIGAKEPSLNRLRGSGQIEEACDMAVLVHRPNRNSDVAKIYIAKGRNIGLAQEIVQFNGDLTYFYDRTDEQPKIQAQSSGWDDRDPLPF